MQARRTRKFRSSHGFTFVELVISLAVIGIAVTGVLLVLTQTVGQSADPMIRQQALAIAEAYLDEISSKHYDDPDGGETFGAEGGENRAGTAGNQPYDDVWDYDGLNEAPTTAQGAAMPQLADYTVQVNVTDGTGELGVTAARIDVSVSHPAGAGISLWSFRSDYNTW